MADDQTTWEARAAAALEAARLPAWDYKARAATYVQGHRGILDLDLEFPEQYLQGPAPICYVWKIHVADGTRDHAYADIHGNRFHLAWEDQQPGRAQNPPAHEVGPCAKTVCPACSAASAVAELPSERPGAVGRDTQR